MGEERFPEPTGSGLIEGRPCVKAFKLQPCFPEPTGSGLIEGRASLKGCLVGHCFPEPTGSGLIEGIAILIPMYYYSKFSGANRLRPH